jgi:hypothetical protein
VCVSSPTISRPTGAADCSRKAVLTTSPVASGSPAFPPSSAPKTAITASLMNFSTTPPYSSMQHLTTE